jgi:hypothetical protein
MGSFRASLELAGKTFDALYVTYAFNRDTDKKGAVSSGVYGGRITCRFESTEDTGVIEGMLNSQFTPVSGKIIFKKRDEDSTMKEVTFENAYIVGLKETLDVNSDYAMNTLIDITAESITIGNATHENRWAHAAG